MGKKLLNLGRKKTAINHNKNWEEKIGILFKPIIPWWIDKSRHFSCFNPSKNHVRIHSGQQTRWGRYWEEKVGIGKGNRQSCVEHGKVLLAGKKMMLVTYLEQQVLAEMDWLWQVLVQAAIDRSWLVYVRGRVFTREEDQESFERFRISPVVCRTSRRGC